MLPHFSTKHAPVWHYCKQLPIKPDPTSLKSEASHAAVLILYFQWLGLVFTRSQHFHCFFCITSSLILDFQSHTKTNPHLSIYRFT